MFRNGIADMRDMVEGDVRFTRLRNGGLRACASRVLARAITSRSPRAGAAPTVAGSRRVRAVGLEVERCTNRPGVSGPLVVGRVQEIEELAGFNASPSGTAWSTSASRRRAGSSAAPRISPSGDLVVRGAARHGATRRLRDRGAHSLRPDLRRDDLLGRRAAASATITPGSSCCRRCRGTRGRAPLRCLACDDAVIELAVTPDRGYCLSARGLARETGHRVRRRLLRSWPSRGARGRRCQPAGKHRG